MLKELATLAHSEINRVLAKMRSTLNTSARDSESRQRRAAIEFPVKNIAEAAKMRTDETLEASGLDVALAIAIEYIAAELLELGGNTAMAKDLKIVTSDHIKIAISRDDALKELSRTLDVSWMGQFGRALPPA